MNNSIATIFSFLFLLGLSVSVCGQTTAEAFDQSLTSAFKSTNIPGMAVAIVNQDKILYQNQFGYADLATKKPYTQNTIHNIGSTSKTFIGVSIIQLVAQGKLTLDTKINDILPFKVVNPYHPEVDITIRQLATHTASIRDRTFNYDLKAYVSDDGAKGNRKGLPLMYKIHFKQMLKNEDVSLGEFLENTLSKKGKWYKKKNYLKASPGTTEEYSNIGAALAGYVVELVSGQSYADYVQQNILTPLGMNASGWTKAKVDTTQFASRYIKGKAVPDYHLTTYPDGGLISSTTDLSKYLMELIKGYNGSSDFLPASAFQTMLTNQFEEAPLKNSITKAEGRSGIFYDIFGKTGNGEIGHSGSDPGILSFMYFDPETGIGCLLMTNTDSDTDGTEVVKMWQMLIKYRNETLSTTQK